MRPKVDPLSPDRAIATLADAQHGVVSHEQLLGLGVSAAAIQRRTRAGRLHRIYRGVYAVGRRRIQREGWWMAATLTAGPGAAISHRSAAALWGLMNPIERDEVTVPSRAGRGERRGLTIHRTSSLPDSEITTNDGIPVTTVPRTFVDLAEIVSRRKLERALDEAEYRRLLSLTEIRATLEAQRGRIGVKRLQRRSMSTQSAAPARTTASRSASSCSAANAASRTRWPRRRSARTKSTSSGPRRS